MQNSGIDHPAHPPFLHLLVDLSKIARKRSCWTSMNRCQVKLYDKLQCFQNEGCALASSPPDRSGEALKLSSEPTTDAFNNLSKSSSKEGNKDLKFLMEKSNSQKRNFLSCTFSWAFITSKNITYYEYADLNMPFRTTNPSSSIMTLGSVRTMTFKTWVIMTSIKIKRLRPGNEIFSLHKRD